MRHAWGLWQPVMLPTIWPHQPPASCVACGEGMPHKQHGELTVACSLAVGAAGRCHVVHGVAPAALSHLTGWSPLHEKGACQDIWLSKCLHSAYVRSVMLLGFARASLPQRRQLQLWQEEARTAIVRKWVFHLRGLLHQLCGSWAACSSCSYMWGRNKQAS